MSCAACGTDAVAVLCFTEGLLLYCGPCDASAHGPESLGADHERVSARHAKAAADAGGGGGAADVPPPPLCDICKAADAVLLCCDDRALMCRGCDRTVHGANEATKAHRRLLLSAVSIGFDPLGAGGGAAAAPAAAPEADKGKGAAGADARPAAAPPAPRPKPAAPPARASPPAAPVAADDEAAVMTMAAELLGLPPGAGAGFTAKDVDAAYLWEATGGGLGGGGGGGGGGLAGLGDDLDFDADLTALLGLDDAGAGPSGAPAFDGGAAGPSGAVGGPPLATPPAAAPPAAPAPAAPPSEGGRSTRSGSTRRRGGGDGVVPEMGGGSKRARG